MLAKLQNVVTFLTLRIVTARRILQVCGLNKLGVQGRKRWLLNSSFMQKLPSGLEEHEPEVVGFLRRLLKHVLFPLAERHATKGTDLRQLLRQARPNWQGPCRIPVLCRFDTQ